MRYKISLLSVAMATIVLASMVATAGVTAAQTVNVNGQVANVYDGSNNQWLFAQGANGNLYYQAHGGSWINLGGPIGSAPAAVSQGGEQVTVYMRSTTGTLISTTTANIATSYTAGGTSGWGALVTMTGTVAADTGPNAVYSASGTVVFYVDSATHALMSDSATTGGLFPSSGNANLGGYVTATPGAVVTSTGGLDVFVRGTQGAVYERMFATGGWSGYTKFHDGTLVAGTGPTAASQSSNIYVYVTGTDLHMYAVSSGDNGLTWDSHFSGALSWLNLGGTLTSSPSGVWNTVPGWDVVVRGADNNIWTYSAGHWNAPPPIVAP